MKSWWRVVNPLSICILITKGVIWSLPRCRAMSWKCVKLHSIILHSMCWGSSYSDIQLSLESYLKNCKEKFFIVLKKDSINAGKPLENTITRSILLKNKNLTFCWILDASQFHPLLFTDVVYEITPQINEWCVIFPRQENCCISISTPSSNDKCHLPHLHRGKRSYLCERFFNRKLRPVRLLKIQHSPF